MTDVWLLPPLAKKEHALQPLYQRRIPNIFFWVASTHQPEKRICFQNQSKAEDKGHSSIIYKVMVSRISKFFFLIKCLRAILKISLTMKNFSMVINTFTSSICRINFNIYMKKRSYLVQNKLLGHGKQFTEKYRDWDLYKSSYTGI